MVQMETSSGIINSFTQKIVVQHENQRLEGILQGKILEELIKKPSPILEDYDPYIKSWKAFSGQNYIPTTALPLQLNPNPMLYISQDVDLIVQEKLSQIEPSITQKVIRYHPSEIITTIESSTELIEQRIKSFNERLEIIQILTKTRDIQVNLKQIIQQEFEKISIQVEDLIWNERSRFYKFRMPGLSESLEEIFIDIPAQLTPDAAVYYLKQTGIINKILDYHFIVDGELVEITTQKTFAQIVEESRASSFTIMGVQAGAANEFRENKNPLSREDVSLKGYNYLYNKIETEHANEEIYKDILKYSSIILDLTLQDGTLPLYKEPDQEVDSGYPHKFYLYKDYFVPSDHEFNELLEGRYYDGLVYEIRVKEGFPDSWFEGKSYVGYTKYTTNIRLATHIYDALKNQLDFEEGKRINPPPKISRAILAALEDLGKDLTQLKEEFSKIISRIFITEEMRQVIDTLKQNYFEISEHEVHRFLEKAKQREKEIIAERDLIKQGLNEIEGGSGGVTKYISYPLYDIIALVTLGANQKDIINVLEKFYPRISRGTLQDKINEYFESWDEVEINYLKPIIEALVLEGYSDREIYDSLVSKNPNYRCFLFSWFKDGLELDFNLWEKIQIFDNIDEVRKSYNKRQEYFGIERSQWEKWLLEGITRDEIAQITGLSVSNVKKVISKKFGGRTNFLISYRREKTIELLRMGVDFKEIFEDHLGMSNFKSHGRETFARWFDGLTLEQIRKLYTQ